jgi:hypothetical protein
VTFRTLDVVVLNTDLPAQGLKRGGAVVEVHTPESIEVEFVTASGRTQAVELQLACAVDPDADIETVEWHRHTTSNVLNGRHQTREWPSLSPNAVELR